MQKVRIRNRLASLVVYITRNISHHSTALVLRELVYNYVHSVISIRLFLSRTLLNNEIIQIYSNGIFSVCLGLPVILDFSLLFSLMQ